MRSETNLTVAICDDAPCRTCSFMFTPQVGDVLTKPTGRPERQG